MSVSGEVALLSSVARLLLVFREFWFHWAAVGCPHWWIFEKRKYSPQSWIDWVWRHLRNQLEPRILGQKESRVIGHSGLTSASWGSGILAVGTRAWDSCLFIVIFNLALCFQVSYESGSWYSMELSRTLLGWGDLALSSPFHRSQHPLVHISCLETRIFSLGLSDIFQTSSPLQDQKQRLLCRIFPVNNILIYYGHFIQIWMNLQGPIGIY